MAFTVEELARNDVDYGMMLKYLDIDSPFKSGYKSVSLNTEKDLHYDIDSSQCYFNEYDTCVYHIKMLNGTEVIQMGMSKYNSNDKCYNRKLGVRIALLRALTKPVMCDRHNFIEAYYNLSFSKHSGYQSSCFTHCAPLVNKAIMKHYFYLEDVNPFVAGIICGMLIAERNIKVNTASFEQQRKNWRQYYIDTNSKIEETYFAMKDANWCENLNNIL